jgi:hypothetical protein
MGLLQRTLPFVLATLQVEEEGQGQHSAFGRHSTINPLIH